MRPLHSGDAELFANHPAPIWEACQDLHTSHINATLPLYGPMLYWLTRATTGPNAVEIGVAQGYSTFYMASAIKDNNTRFGMNGKLVAIDIMDKSSVVQPMIDEGLPIEFWHTDSLKVTNEMLSVAFPTGIDMLFQDGWHNTEHCQKELELYYPHVKGNGNGYICMHDVYAYCEVYFNNLRKDARYNLEYVRFLNNYGFAICRKMDGYDNNKVYWTDGCQPEQDLGNIVC